MVERWNGFEGRTYTTAPLRGPSDVKSVPLERIFPPTTSLGYGGGEYEGVVRLPLGHYVQSLCRSFI